MTPSEVVGERVKELRGDVSQQHVADRIAALGHRLDRSAIARIENQQRGVSIEDALFLSAALRVPLAALLVPTDGTLDIGHVQLDAAETERWMSGERPAAVFEKLVLDAAKDYARRHSGKKEWAERVTSRIVSDERLREEFDLSLAELASDQRAFKVQLVLAAAAYLEEHP